MFSSTLSVFVELTEAHEKCKRYMREAEVACLLEEGASKASWRGRAAALLHGLTERLEPPAVASEKARTL